MGEGCVCSSIRNLAATNLGRPFADMQSTPTTKKIKLSYKDAPQKVSFSPSGVWGGNNFQGQLVCNFYVESRPYPTGSEVRIEAGKKPIVETTQQAEDDEMAMVREVLASVVFDPALAIVVGEWLVRHGTKLRDDRKRGTPPRVVLEIEKDKDVAKTPGGEAETK